MELLNRCRSNNILLSVLITALFLLKFGSSLQLPWKCESLDAMLKKMNGTTKNDTRTVQCRHEGLACAKYSCQVHFVIANKTVTLKGSFGCEKAEPSYNISLIDGGKTNQIAITNNTTTKTFEKVKLSASVTFSQPSATTGEREVKGTLSISLEEVEVIFPPMSLSVPNLVCTCPNLDKLDSQLMDYFNSSSKQIDISCWPDSTSCRSFLCRAQTQVPDGTFSFHGSVFCQSETSIYFLTFVGLLKPSPVITAANFSMSTENGTDIIFNKKIRLGNGATSSILVKANAAFHKRNITFTRMTSGVTIEYDFTKDGPKTLVCFNVTLDFELNCKTLAPTTSPTPKPPTPAPTPTVAPTLAPPTTPPTTPTTIPPTTMPPTTTATTPTTPNTSVKHTTTSSKKSGHKPARAVLIVLAVLIVVAVILVGIYFKRKKRLSNQPAYYNDIAINDPLHYELDGEDDELPLFS